MVSAISNEITMSLSDSVSSETNLPEISLFDEIVKKFADSFSKANKKDDEVKAEAKNIIESVDQDKNGTLSMQELTTFDYKSCPSEMAAKIADLCRNFKAYDKDGNGELCMSEVETAIGDKQYSLQELKAMAAKDDENQSKMNFGAMSDSFFKSMINNYEKVSAELTPNATSS